MMLIRWSSDLGSREAAIHWIRKMAPLAAKYGSVLYLEHPKQNIYFAWRTEVEHDHEPLMWEEHDRGEPFSIIASLKRRGVKKLSMRYRDMSEFTKLEVVE